MRAVIYTGGEILPDRVAFRTSPDDLVIAADTGLRAGLTFGARPALLLGDLDSLGVPAGERPAGLPAGTEILRVPAEKDDTDTQLAVSVALERGADEMLIFGGFGGRPDHSLANLAILEDLARRGVPALLDSGRARARFVLPEAGTVTIPREARFRYLSLLPAGERSVGVTLSGVRYPLSDAVLYRRRAGYSISNEITAPAAALSLRSGPLWVMEAGD